MKSFVRGATLGFRSLFAGLRLIRSDVQILRLAIIPFLIDFLVLIGVFLWGGQHLSGWVEKGLSWVFADSSGFLWSLAYGVALVLSWLVFIAVLFFLGYILAGIVAAPFNSLLAEVTLERLGVIQKQPFSWSRWAGQSLRMMWAGVLKAMLFLGVGFVLFAASFVPVLGLVASFGFLMIMAFDSADYSFEVLGLNLRQRLSYFLRHKAYFVGVAGSLGLTLFIPGLNFVLFPAAVVGSADLIHRVRNQES